MDYTKTSLKKLFPIALVVCLLFTSCSSLTKEERELVDLNLSSSNYHNSINLKSTEIPGKVCYVEETDTLFYSDGSGLYQKNGDKTVTLLEKPVISINIADGKLYYISADSDENSVITGKGYCLDLSNMSEKLVIDEDINNLYVYKNTIFYYINHTETQTIDNVKYYAVYFDFKSCHTDGSETKDLPYSYFVVDGNYSVSDPDRICTLADLETGERKNEEVLSGVDASIELLSIYEGFLYNFDITNTGRTYIKKFNLEDGSKESLYATNPNSDPSYIRDYGFCDGYMYLYGASFHKICEDGSVEVFSCYENGKECREYKAIYTGGDKMYGVSGKGDIYELSFSVKDGQNIVNETLLQPEQLEQS